MQVKSFVWPAVDTQAIAKLQTVTAAANLMINGTYAVMGSGKINAYQVQFWQNTKVVTITSANYDLSGVNFTVTGVLAGAPVSQTLAGPNESSVTTTQTFDTVLSVTTSPSIFTDNSIAVFPHFSRTVGITSSANLSARTFTITGYFLGNLVTESLTGPNANTVYSTNIYDEIIDVFVDGSISPNTVSVGTGLTGQTQYYNYDVDAKLNSTSFEVVVESNTINWTVVATLEDVTKVATPFFTTLGSPNQSTSHLFSIQVQNFWYCTLQVTQGGGGTDATGSLIFYILEGGIR